MRTFSGKIPKPPGEADYETWSLHAELMFNDDSLSVDVQRRKVLESLLPPASDVVRQLGTSAHPRHYVQLLDSAYGLVEDGEEVFARFLNTNQNPGEKASDYLQRLRSVLCTAVKRGGANQVNADRHLLKQFKHGCWDHSLVLQLELKNEIPPNFAELLLQVRTEEDRRASKSSCHDRMQRHFGSSKTKPSVNINSVSDISLSDSNASLLQSYISETESLRKQVAQLQMQLSSKKYKKDKKQEFKGTVPTNNSPPPVAEAQAHNVMPQNTSIPRPQPKAWFCYKCGEDGHIARSCDKPMNKALVDQKYAELRHKQDEWKAAVKLERVPVTGPTGTEDTEESPISKWRCETKCQQATATARRLIRRLVGSRHVARVTVGGVQQNCLMDGGSQVTTITKSFHETHLPSRPIIPIEDLLHIEGAAGQHVPYIGCIEVDVAFPEHFTGEPKVVTTLALVVPDPRTSGEVPVLIGTNTLDILYKGFNEGTTISPD